MHESYENELKKYSLSPGVKELFDLVLASGGFLSDQEHILERKQLLRQVYEKETLILSARKLFIKSEIEVDDFRAIKKNYNDAIQQLNVKIDCINDKLKKADMLEKSVYRSN